MIDFKWKPSKTSYGVDECEPAPGISMYVISEDAVFLKGDPEVRWVCDWKVESVALDLTGSSYAATAEEARRRSKELAEGVAKILLGWEDPPS